MNPHYILVAKRALHRCEYCHAPEIVFNFPFEVEHIIPLAREGMNIESNWALACRSCNLHKGSYITALDPEANTAVRLFHPREEHWEEHFEVNLESGLIVGKTASGRATIICLGMNSQLQLMARRQWMSLGIFP
ncbi:MAG: HNH endonuclease signature motif containing protein [Caldilineaceae bacterium]